MAEAHVVYGDDLLDRPVVQVVSSLSPAPRAGSLVVTRAEILVNSKEPFQLKDLAGLVLIKAALPDPISSSPKTSLTSVPALVNAQPNAALAAVSPDLSTKRIVKLCSDSGLPLIVVPGLGEPGQVADDIRMAFLREIKLARTRLHASFLGLLLDEGLEGLVEELSSHLNRPVSIETADFKVLASRNMGATPANQQRSLSEETQNALKRITAESGTQAADNACLSPIKIGRRLVLPICLSDGVVGYLSVMVRPNDDLETIGDTLQACALAAMVEFSQRKKDGSVFSVTQKSLLKDLLSGRGLSASDQERLERHYGFDLADGILVFAVQTAGKLGMARSSWPEEQFITTEVEGTRVYLLAYNANSGVTWQEESGALIARIKAATEGSAASKFQIGAARMAETLLDLPDAYREARQALIIGSMIHGESPFMVGYGELGIKRLLYLMIDHPELDRFYEETLAPLEAYDLEWESELVPSLRVYLQQGANLNSAARSLYIHRHTLRYRLEQIAEILKVDIDAQEVLLNLQIAFMIGDMKRADKGKT